MTTQHEREYVLGTDPAELERMGFQHRLWATEANELWRRANFAPGQTILDVGCGPGFASRELAELLKREGRVIALDESRRYLDYLRASIASVGGEGSAPIEVVEGDAQAIDLPEASVDGAWTRWVLHFTPEPERVVESVARVLRPGGRWAVQDYCAWRNLFWGPRCDTLPLLRKGILGMYESQRADSDIGRKLPAMCHRHGLRVRDLYPISAVIRPDETRWQWPMTFFTIFLPKVVAAGFLTEDERLAIMEELAEVERTPGGFFWTPPMIGLVVEKA